MIIIKSKIRTQGKGSAEMIEDRLTQRLQNTGYQLLNSNIGGVYLYYRITGREAENEAYVISVIHADSGNEFTVEQYRHMLEQIKADFKNRGNNRLNLLSLIFTRNPDKVKQFCLEEDGHWIIDTGAYHLIIYENQSSDFMGLRREIEAVLDEEFQNQREPGQVPDGRAYENPTYRGGVKSGGMSNLQIFTLMNTIIIAVNIIVFLITHYTKLLGGTEQIIANGGTFWYDVIKKNQYYRILTAMFLHYDLNHIFNNMLVLTFMGAYLERATGKLRYLLLYFGSGLIADMTSIVYNMVKDNLDNEIVIKYSIGASGAIFGVIGAILYIIIINRGRLENIGFRQMILFVVFGLYGGIANAGIDNAAHIGGFISGVILAALLYRRPLDSVRNKY
jgi:rhomboid protease GluP